MARQPYTDPDDYFNDSRMTFPEHIEDLRAHLIRAIVGFVAGVLIAFLFSSSVLEGIARPVETQLEDYWQRYYNKKRATVVKGMRDGTLEGQRIVIPPIKIEKNRLRQFIGLPPIKDEPLDPIPADMRPVLRKLGMSELLEKKEFQSERNLILTPDPDTYVDVWINLNMAMKPPRLHTFSVQEAFMVFFMVSLMTGLVISCPWVFYHIWAFIAAGLYPHEKRLVNVYLPFSICLFLAGVAVCYFIVLPKAIAALLWFNEWLGLQPELRLSEWLGFAILMPVVFGLSFQTPLVMMFVERVGIVDVSVFRDNRRFAWMAMAIFAAVITPSTDALSMMFLWLPMSLLYEFGIFMCVMRPRSEFEELDADEEELIEV